MTPASLERRFTRLHCTILLNNLNRLSQIPTSNCKRQQLYTCRRSAIMDIQCNDSHSSLASAMQSNLDSTLPPNAPLQYISTVLPCLLSTYCTIPVETFSHNMYCAKYYHINTSSTNANGSSTKYIAHKYFAFTLLHWMLFKQS